jgi:2-haloacid dehalogenase
MATPKLENISACVFDAYGTLFDVNAAAQHCAGELGEQWQPLADLWRTKQLQYTWLRALMGKHKDFWQVTGDALDFAMASLGLDDAGLRGRLADLYMSLDCYPEVPETLRRLKASGIKTAILSNGTPEMLEAAAANAGIRGDLDAILSVESVGIFKPHPSVYKMAEQHFGIESGRMSFQSSNAWDAYAASSFGFRVVWINRFGQAHERLPGQPDVELSTLHDLPAIVGAE